MNLILRLKQISEDFHGVVGITNITQAIKNKDYKLLRRGLMFLWQKITTGWCGSDLWSLDDSLAKVIVTPLKLFKQYYGGTPMKESGDAMTDKEWKEILNKMIWSFQYIADGKMYSANSSNIIEDSNKVQEGLNLFGKHFRNLWT